MLVRKSYGVQHYKPSLFMVSGGRLGKTGDSHFSRLRVWIRGATRCEHDVNFVKHNHRNDIVKKVLTAVSFGICLGFFFLVHASPDNSDQLDEGLYEHLLLVEGIAKDRSIDISKLIDQLVLSNGHIPESSLLLKVYERHRSEAVGEVAFHLALLGLAIRGSEDAAFAFYEANIGQLTVSSYMDYVPRDPDQMGQYAYDWLVNNAVFSVPSSFVRMHGELFSKTPRWHATRDTYFSVEYQDDSYRKFVSGEKLKRFNQDLYAVFNPGNCWAGSMYYVLEKDFAIDMALALIQGRQNFSVENAAWLEIWRLSGGYNDDLYQQLMISKEAVQQDLVDLIVNGQMVNQSIAERLADGLLSRQIARYTNRTRDSYPADHQMLFDVLLQEGIDRVVELIVDMRVDISVFSGLVVEHGTLEDLLGWYEFLRSDRESWSPGEEIGDFLGLASAYRNTSELQLLLQQAKFEPSNQVWGGFGKTPMMYALQTNQAANYNLLKASYPRMVDLVMPSDEYDCGPTIRGRTVLTYALENADLTVINLVIADVSAEILGSRDSAGSNAFFYLRKNSLLQPKEIDSIAKTLNSHGVFED